MKKRNILTILAAVIAVISATALVLYLFRDKLASCPVCGKFFPSADDDDDDFFDEDFFDEIEAEEAEEEEEAAEEEVEEEEAPEEKHPQTKVRRGYIPLKFHKEELEA